MINCGAHKKDSVTTRKHATNMRKNRASPYRHPRVTIAGTLSKLLCETSSTECRSLPVLDERGTESDSTSSKALCIFRRGRALLPQAREQSHERSAAYHERGSKHDSKNKNKKKARDFPEEEALHDPPKDSVADAATSPKERASTPKITSQRSPQKHQLVSRE